MTLKILDRYAIKGYALPFAASLGTFGILVILVRYFERMNTFSSTTASLATIGAYLILGVPYWLNLVLPVATILALLFALGGLQQRGELTAMRTAGIASWRLWTPYFVAAFVLSVVSLVGSLSFLPKLNFEARSIYRTAIRNREAVSYRKDNIVAAGQGNRQFTIGWLDIENQSMTEVIMDQFDPHFRWIESISAKRAVYDNGAWRFEVGVHRMQDPIDSRTIREEKFQVKIVHLKERPKDFMVEDKHPDDMTGGELTRRIRRLKRLGAKTDAERMSLHLRIALPFANLIVIALGIPFAVRQGRKGRLQTFAFALGASFAYWGAISVFESIGYAGRLWPWAAAWTPNVLFAGAAALLFRKLA